VLDRQDFDVVGMNAIGDNIRRSHDDQFTCAAKTPGSAATGGAIKPLDGPRNGADHARRSGRIVGVNTRANTLKTPAR
jgi:hypothetical protein